MIGSVAFDPMTAVEAATHIRDAITRGRGGRLALVAHDQLRHVDEWPGLRDALDGADLVLAGSATAVWASRLAGRPLPERVTAAGLVDALGTACAADGRRVYLIGGRPGGPGIPSAAQRAAAILGLRHQGLRVAGCASPAADLFADRAALGAVVADVVEAKPDLVLVGLDSLVAEGMLVGALRVELVESWLFGCRDLVREVVGDAGGGHRGVDVSYTARLLARAAAARRRRRT